MMNNPRTVEDVIKDFKGRRSGIIKALTKDVEDFYQLCDPNHPNLCLYGFPSQEWEVNLPPPSDLPEPRLGINFARDTMTKHEWLNMVAVHSDAWLYSTATYFAAKFSFDKADRKRLFNKITDVASICEVVQGKSKKRTKLEGGGLPDHVLEGVISRLPARELLKFRSVCKMWRALIDDPGFETVHLKNFRNNSEVSHLLVMYRAPRSWAGEEQLLVRRGDTYRKVTELENSVSVGDYDVVTYVNGVVLLRKGKLRLFREIVLWNPSINRSFKVVPGSNYEAIKDASFFELGLGYDASRNDYKVIAIVYPHAEIKYNFGVRYRATIPGLVHVYTLSTNTWTTNFGVGPPPSWSVGRQAYVNGAIHWINFGPDVTDDSWSTNKDTHVVSFDLEHEVFKYFALPSAMKSDDEPHEKFPTVFEESLAIFCAHNESRIDIWVMGEYGVSNSWSKRYSFTLQYDKLLHFRSNGELLFALDWKGIKSYDVKREKAKDLAKTYSRSSKHTVYTYIESLVLSKQGTKRP